VDVNFVKLFKASFKLYVESGMRNKVEAAVDKWRNEQSGQRVTKDSELQEKFHRIIIGHYLRKFHCLCLHLTNLIFKYSSP
jgi:hypothetical protein